MHGFVIAVARRAHGHVVDSRRTSAWWGPGGAASSGAQAGPGALQLVILPCWRSAHGMGTRS
jgi:hypothetical protein